VVESAARESSYVGRHADYYDVIYAGKDYAREARFVDSLLRQHGATRPGALLELACGTGRHAREFAALGYDVTATDYSDDMLRVARQKCADAPRAIQLRRLDMREVGAEVSRYPAIVSLFDSIGYVRDNAAVAQVLMGVRQVLAPGGLFVFEFWHAPAMLRGYDPARVRRFQLPAGELVRISETRLDVAAQLAHVSYDLIELRSTGEYVRLRETQVNRFFFLPEMTAYLQASGLELLAAHAGFDASQSIDADTWHIVAVACAR
jgi:SAM-dependent methyltransferase